MKIEDIKAVRAAKLTAAPVTTPEFISLHELLIRLKTHGHSLQDAAQWLIFNWCNTDNPPAFLCRGKHGILPIDTFSKTNEIPLKRLDFVCHRGFFECDGPQGESTDYEFFGFDRKDFADFLNVTGEPLDLFCAVPTAPATLPATPAPVETPKARRNGRKPSWKDIAKPYLEKLYAAGNYRSGTEFYRTAKRRAGEPGSPFKIVDQNLFCIGAGTVQEGTFKKIWKTIRAE